MNKRAYKVVGREDWRTAQTDGRFRGAEIDLADGYIHLSDADQVEETVKRHFAGQSNLLLVAFNSDDLGEELR